MTWMFAFLAVVWLLSPQYHHAKAVPENGLEITMSVSPMSGIHSDWYRKISVEFDGNKISKKLFPDTGWWRGSNLYRHVSGAYVIHEGQGGCFSIALRPLRFVAAPPMSCEKSAPRNRASDQHSRFYEDLIFLGQFYETWRDKDGVRLRFSDFHRVSEPELPGSP